MANFNFIIIFILGLSVGSFLNVLIDRLPKNISVTKGRSRCDFCKHMLRWYDLVPIVSFLLLKRRCRYCHKILSYQYPLIEIITGLIFLLSYKYSIDFTQFLLNSVAFSGFLVLFMTDVKYKILPDQIIIFLLVVTLLNITIFPQNSFLNYLLSALVYYLIFLSIYLFTKGRGMGFGDVKLVFLLGLYLGYPKVIVSFYLAFLTGAFFSLILVFIGRKKMKSTIAFGPFLIFSAIISNFYGLELFSVLLNLIGL